MSERRETRIKGAKQRKEKGGRKETVEYWTRVEEIQDKGRRQREEKTFLVPPVDTLKIARIARAIEPIFTYHRDVAMAASTFFFFVSSLPPNSLTANINLLFPLLFFFFTLLLPLLLLFEIARGLF